MVPKDQLRSIGIDTDKDVHHNLSVARLVEMALQRNEGRLAANGALVVKTGERTGRSPDDRFVARTPDVEGEIWRGKVNVETSPEKFDYLFKKVQFHLKDKDLFIFDAFSGADRAHSLPIRVISPRAWHSLFIGTLFVRPKSNDLQTFAPGFTVINATDDLRLTKEDGFRSEVAIVVNFEKKMILLAGTGYGGEMKKGIFAVMNYLLPKKGVFPMHCSANVGENGDSALFFGLSGTGKTTLSADPRRHLIGDDEHGWSDEGIFNFEGGCYAKCINLSKETEPQIYDAIRFGSILENVVIDDHTRAIDYDDGSITENTRATYPVEHISNCLTEGICDHPSNIFFLTCDAFGVLPPIAKLTPEMAMYYFISGYTAKVAGTEVGVKEPIATFSACFGSPFLPLHPGVYAELLRKKMNEHQANCWLVNTGWSGGAYGEGKRMKIGLTRSLLDAALSGELSKAEFTPHPIFKILVPNRCPGVDSKFLDAKKTWKDQTKYDETAKKLAALFNENFDKYSDRVLKEVLAAGPIA